MNEIVNKLLLVGNKFMPEMHLKQRGFTYSACGSFIKNKEIIQKFMQTGNTDFIYKNELDKGCFQHDMAYAKSKDFIKGTQSDKVLKDKAFKFANNPNYDGYQRGLTAMVYKFFDKRSKGSGIINEPNYQLANELHKPIIKPHKFKKIKVYSSYRDNVWGFDLADMPSLSKYLIDKGICDKGFIWNPSNFECECDKNCDIGEYLDYENCKCRKKIVDKLIDECTATIE